MAANKTVPLLFWFFAAISALGVLTGSLSVNNAALINSRTSLVATLLAVILFFVAYLRKIDLVCIFSAVQAAFIAFLFYLFSEVMQRSFGFFVDARMQWMILAVGVITLSTIWFIVSSTGRSDVFERLFSWPTLLFFQALIVVLFLQYTGDRAVFSDDHPSFWYRFHLLQQQFPYIPFYNADWEAGYSAREFFPSGILNVFFLTLPIWYLGVDFSTTNDLAVYNYLISYVFVFILPISVYFSASILGANRGAAIISALLSLGPTTGFFEWLLKYGTLGFCASVGLAPLVVALSIRFLFTLERPRIVDVVVLLIASYLCIAWTLSSFIFVPLVVYGLFRLRDVFAPNRRVVTIAFVLLFFVLNGPWLLTFFEESKVLSFVSKSSMPGVEQVHSVKPKVEQKIEKNNFVLFSAAKKQIKKLRQAIFKFNPLLVIFALPGLCFIRAGPRRSVLCLTILWLFVLSLLGEMLKPQLELKRMLIPAAFLLCIPVGIVLENYLREGLERAMRLGRVKQRLVYIPCAALIVGALFLSPINVAAVYQNRSDERYKLTPDLLGSLSEAIAEDGGDGRTFVLGFIVHDFGASNFYTPDGGHIAPLAAFSGKPMYAFDYYHSKWTTVDPIPRSFRDRGEEGIEEFLDLVNATAVVTFKREWYLYCRERADRYEQVFKQGVFRI